VPDVVIGLPEIEMPVPADAATEVTVPELVVQPALLLKILNGIDEINCLLSAPPFSAIK